MKKKLIASITTGLFLAGIAVTANASLVNSGFETGDFTGWTTNPTNGGSVAVVTTDAGFGPTEGSYFANLTADATISQGLSFNAGDKLSFDWNFNSNDYAPFDDYSIFQVINTSNVMLVDVKLATVLQLPNYTATGWNTFTWTFTMGDVGDISFGVMNCGDTINDSQLYIDNVQAPVPEPSSMALLLIGCSALAAYRKKRMLS